MTIPEQAIEAAQNVIRTANWEYGITDADMAKALTAAAPYMSGVKVKQLEWGELNEGKTFRALLPIIGSIRVEPYGVCGWWEVLWSMPGQCDKLVPDVFDTPEEAKAAAQADYEKRVLSALEPSSAREQAMEEILRELSRNPRQLIDMVASAIRDNGGDLCDGSWESLSYDRKQAWRGDAERALTAVKEYLTTRVGLSGGGNHGQ